MDSNLMETDGRGRGIRTHDIQLPKLALYQAELYPEAGTFVAHQRRERPNILVAGALSVNDTSTCSPPAARAFVRELGDRLPPPPGLDTQHGAGGSQIRLAI